MPACHLAGGWHHPSLNPQHHPCFCDWLDLTLRWTWACWGFIRGALGNHCLCNRRERKREDWEEGEVGGELHFTELSADFSVSSESGIALQHCPELRWWAWGFLLLFDQLLDTVYFGKGHELGQSASSMSSSSATTVTHWLSTDDWIKCKCLSLKWEDQCRWHHRAIAVPVFQASILLFRCPWYLAFLFSFFFF